MNNISDELDYEIKEYLEKIDNMSYNDKLDALRNLFIKHLQLENSEFILNKYNLNSIESSSKREFTEMPTKLILKGTLVSPEKRKILAIIQATIGELRHIKTLRKVVKFKFDDEY